VGAALTNSFRSKFMSNLQRGNYCSMDSATPSTPPADAAHDMAFKAAEGIDVPQNWAAALDHLQQAAELGSFLAQAELAALSGRWKLAHAILAGELVRRFWRPRFLSFIDLAKWPKPAQSQWSRLRSSIKLEKWLTAPYSISIISEAPRMAIVKDLATPEICDWLIARARPRMKRARVYGHDGKKAVIQYEGHRTNSSYTFRRPECDLIMAILRARIAEATQMEVLEFELPALLYYSVGQEFRRHYDSPADPNAPGFRQRVITLLLSLNEDYEGGITEFPVVGGKWRGRKGTAIYFWNVMPDGTRDERSLHGGLPVTHGEKWLMTQFIDRPRQA
jgi:prolyl 4-hydroxylase